MDTLMALLAIPRRRNTAAIGTTLRIYPTVAIRAAIASRPPRMTFFIDTRSFSQPVGKAKTMGAAARSATMRPIATPSNPSLMNWSGARNTTVVNAIVRTKLMRWTRRMPAIIDKKRGDTIPVHLLNWGNGCCVPELIPN